jgi:outer membrane lipoprotein-sorting protein
MLYRIISLEKNQDAVMRNGGVMKSRLIVAVLLLVCLGTGQAVRAGEADQIKQHLASVVDAYGGKEAVSRVRSVVAKGTITDFMKRSQGAYSRAYARPGKLRIEIMADPAGEVRILNGNQGWRGNGTTQVAVQGPPLEAMIYQYTYLDLPMGFADGTYSAVFQGRTGYRGRELNLVVIEPKGAPKVRIYLDPKSNLIVRVASDFNMGMGSSELSTEYEDFRPVGKVLFPFRLVNYAGDMKLSVIELSDIQVNPGLPEAEFMPHGNK